MSELVFAPEDDVKAVERSHTCARSTLDRALSPTSRPCQIVCAKDETRVGVHPAFKDEGRCFAIDEVPDCPADEWKVGVPTERNVGSEAQPPGEPWLDLMNPAAL